MYAVIESGGKQYRVTEGQHLKLETLVGEPGESVHFEKVLFLANGETMNVGIPYVENAKVRAKIVEHGRAKKIHIIKFKRRKHHMKQQGHRQNYTEVKIEAIEA